jgi:HAMP domain-containing protein/putative methionine-R-sulfoxide reductase with GAF domain
MQRRDTQPLPHARPRRRLGTRLALILLPLVLIPILLMGGAAYLRARTILQTQARDQLVALTQSQLEVMRQWARVREQALQLGSQRPELSAPLDTMMESRAGSPSFVEAQSALRSNLESLLRRGDETVFSEMMFVHLPDGTISAATAPELEGRTLDPVQRGTIPTDRLTTTPAYNDPVFAPGNLAMVTSTPVLPPGGGAPVGLLIGVNRGLRIGQLMQSMQALWENQGVYRVERGDAFLALQPNVRVGLERYSTDPIAQAMVSHPVYALATNAATGSYQYRDPDSGGTEVGAFQWDSALGMGVVLEIPSSDIFSSLGTLAPFTAALIVVSGLATFFIVFLVTNRQLRPLGDLTDFAERLSRGGWDHRVPENRQDEIGALAAAFNRMASDLSGLYGTLEARVEERTRQVRTAAEVAHAVTSTPNLDDLLRRAVDLVRDRFGYYHATIFLLDGEGKNAVVRESTGEVGQLMKARHHSLAVGSQSVIGWVTANNQGRIATEVGSDPVHLKNELLPETRSEAAVPLQVSGRVLGALDVQSTEPNAFRPEDLELLQTLADQLSAAIQNARLAEESALAAERARMLSNVTGQFGGLMDVEKVLETAAQTLHRVLGQPEIMITLATGEDESAGENGNGRE